VSDRNGHSSLYLFISIWNMSRNVTSEYNILWCSHTYLFTMLCQLSVIPQNTTVKHNYGILWTNVSAFCHTTKHYCEAHVWYTLNKKCLFSFQKHLLGSWLGSELECGKLHEYFSDVQRLVRVVSYLHLAPG
jgi:hypothetical protein